MNNHKHMKKIIGEALKEYGFMYQSMGAHGCKFVKEGEERKQEIYIDTIRKHKNMVRMIFHTNAYGQKEVYVHRLVPSGYKGMNGIGFWEWTKEEEFIRIMELFREIILERGLETLEKISMPTTEERPKPETEKRLYERRESLNKEYRKRLGLKEDSRKEQALLMIYKEIIKTRKEEFSKIEEDLIGLAAVYGEELIRQCNGEWEWTGNACIIKGIGREGKGVKNPLGLIIWCRNRKAEPFQAITDPFDEYCEEKVSIPTKEQRTEETMERMLYENHWQLNKDYRKKRGLEGEKSTAKVLLTLYERIKDTRDQELSQVKEELVEIAAVYGEEVVEHCGGEWGWNEWEGYEGYEKACRIGQVGKLEKVNRTKGTSPHQLPKSLIHEGLGRFVALSGVTQ